VKAYASCECGTTRCPHEEGTIVAALSSARTWLLKLKFARVEHGTMLCVICRQPMELRVEKTEPAE